MKVQSKIRAIGLSIMLLSSGFMLAQETITDSDMPGEGSEYFLSIANPVNEYDFTLTGPNYNWDFSDLEALDQRPQMYVPVSGAPLGYQFVFNNPFDEEHYADFANAQEGFELGGQFSFEDFYAFYQNDSASYTAVGYAGTINGIPLPAGSSPIDVVYSFPMEYDDSFDNYSEWQIQIPGILTYKLKQTRSYEVDGWGTVTTPYGTFDALRVRMQIDAIDSISIEALSFSFENERNSVEYQWLSPGEGIPVLQATENLGIVSNVNYKDEQIIRVPEIVSDFTVYPNPTTGIIKIEANKKAPIQVYDGALNLVRDVPGNKLNTTLDLSDLAKGVYFIRMGEEDVQKIILE